MPRFRFFPRQGVSCLLRVLALTWTAAASAASEPPSLPPPTPPGPALVAFARAHEIPLESIDVAGAPGTTRAPEKGDVVTLLITVARGETREQWLATLTGDDLTPAEAALPPQPKATIYTFTGQKLEYERTRAALAVYLAGPFAPAGAAEPARAPEETRHHTLVTREYLVHGIEPFARSALEVGPRMLARGWGSSDGYAAGFNPWPESALKYGRHFAEKYQVTPEEERLENEAYLAMVSFFDTARGIPAFNRLAKTALDTPSVWSLTKNFGLSSTMLFRWVDVAAQAPAAFAVAQPAYRFPLTVLLNQTVATRATLVVTAPTPPLHLSAGILAIEAEHPTDPTRRFSLRVLAARRGADRDKP